MLGYTSNTRLPSGKFRLGWIFNIFGKLSWENRLSQLSAPYLGCNPPWNDIC